MKGKWTARRIDDTARVEILDEGGGLVCVTTDNHADDIVGQRDALSEIYAQLDGKEWNANTTANIAEILLRAGYEIRACNEEDEDDAE